MRDITGTVTNQGNFNLAGGTECSFDTDGIGHIMSILSNMYSDAPLAVLREYSCNARDSHIAAGQDLPIEVTLPSDLSPSLLIQDYGVGLSRDEIINVYSKYGASTKRNTNDQVGAFGIGAKSAFTIGQQFIVTGVKDGSKTVALFALNENNVGTVNILSETDTDEPNGVLVSLAVDQPQVMWETASRFFATWRPGTVLVNGQEPESVYADGEQITDNTWVRQDGQGVRMVMGGVAYPVSRAILGKAADRLTGEGKALAERLRDWSSNLSIYADVEIGSVDITPSREDLRDTEKTLTTVTTVLDNLARAVLKTYTDKINGAATYWEAAETLDRLLADLNAFGLVATDFTWNGLHLGKVKVELTNFILGYARGNKKRVETHGDFWVTAPQYASKVLAVTGVTNPGSVSRTAKRYLEQNSAVKERIVITDADAVSFQWFEIGAGAPVETVTLDEFKARCKALAPVYVREANEPSYSVGTGKPDQWTVRTPLSEIVAMDKEIVFFTDRPAKSDLLDKVLEDRVAIVLLPTQKKEALLKRIPDAIDGAEEIQVLAEKVIANVNDDDLLLLAANDFRDNNYTAYSALTDLFGKDLDGITNKTVRSFVSLYTEASEMVRENRARIEEIQNARHRVGTSLEYETFDGIDLGAFPLLNLYVDQSWRYSRRPEERKVFTEHLTAYINGMA
jgi:hypothetical protein